MELVHTPNQPIGPFFHFALTSPSASRRTLAGPDSKGERVQLAFRVLDRDGKPVTNAMVELWQADGDGEYNSASFFGFGRLASDDDGLCPFETVKPGRVAGWSGKLQALRISMFRSMRRGCCGEWLRGFISVATRPTMRTRS